MVENEKNEYIYMLLWPYVALGSSTNAVVLLNWWKPEPIHELKASK